MTFHNISPDYMQLFSKQEVYNIYPYHDNWLIESKLILQIWCIYVNKQLLLFLFLWQKDNYSLTSS